VTPSTHSPASRRCWRVRRCDGAATRACFLCPLRSKRMMGCERPPFPPHTHIYIYTHTHTHAHARTHICTIYVGECGVSVEWVWSMYGVLLCVWREGPHPPMLRTVTRRCESLESFLPATPLLCGDVDLGWKEPMARVMKGRGTHDDRGGGSMFTHGYLFLAAQVSPLPLVALG
jgi:hypothetical protein